MFVRYQSDNVTSAAERKSSEDATEAASQGMTASIYDSLIRTNMTSDFNTGVCVRGWMSADKSVDDGRGGFE